jgi:hypothetical protein
MMSMKLTLHTTRLSLLAHVVMALLAFGSSEAIANDSVLFLHSVPEPSSAADAFRDHLARAMADSGFDVQVVNVPWIRVHEIAGQRPGRTCLVFVEESYAKQIGLNWQPMGVKAALTLYAARGVTAVIREPKDANQYRVGVPLNSPAQRVLERAGVKSEGIPTAAKNLNQLYAGRIDLWAIYDLAAPQFAKDGNADISRPVYQFPAQEIGFGCGPSLEPELQARIGARLESYGKKIDGKWINPREPSPDR